MNRFCFKTNYNFNKLIKTIRCIYYGEERSSMARKAEPIIIESVEYDYVGTEEQFRSFIKNIVRDYLVENNLFPDIISKEKIIMKTSA